MQVDCYRAVNSGSIRTVIHKSIFITFTFPIADETEAAAHIKSLREKYPDATHVCYGYIADAGGTVHRFSDDGEPSGTAGMPILEVLKNKDLRCSLVAVVRYFGGIKLGAGGLTRAYAGCAADAVQAAGVAEYARLNVYKITADFADCNKIKKIPRQTLCKIETLEYNSSVTMTVFATDDLPKAVCDLTCGRAKVELLGQKYVTVQ